MGDNKRMKSRFIQLLVLLLGLCSMADVFASIDYITERFYFEDKTGMMNFDEAKDQSYHKMPSLLAKGFSSSTFWIRLTIDPIQQNKNKVGALDGKIILSILPTYLDSITLYDPVKITKDDRTIGDHYPTSANEFNLVNFNFVISKTDKSRYVYLKLKTTSTNLIFVQGLDPDDCSIADREQDLYSASYIGFLALLFLIPLLSWIKKRESLYAVFLLKQLSSLLLVIFHIGIHRLVFPSVNPLTLDLAFNFNIVIFGLINAFFIYRFIGDYAVKKWLIYLYQIIFLCYPVIFLLLIFDYIGIALHFNMQILNLIAISFLLIPLLGIDWKKEHKGALSKIQMFVLFISIFIIGVITTLPSLGYLPAIRISPFIGLAYGGITGLIFLLVLQHRQRVASEKDLIQITTLKNYADAEQQKLIERDNFLSMLTHELKTSLSVLRLSMSSKDKWSKNFKYIEETLIEMNQLLERVVLTQKFESDQLKLNEEILEINHLVTNVINFYDNPDVFEWNKSDNLEIHTDEQILRIILKNILDNAIKYGDATQPIQISIKQELRDQIQYVVVTVKNTIGEIGVPDPQQIFNKYYRSPKAFQKSGSGLGLYIVKNLADLLDIYVEYHTNDNDVIFRIGIPKL